MKPLQVMRAVLNALKQPSLFSKGTAMQRRPLEASAGSAPAPSPAAFRRHHAAVFVDPSGHLNLAAYLSKSAVAEASDMSLLERITLTCRNMLCTVSVLPRFRAHGSEQMLAMQVQSAARHGLRLLDQAADQETAFAELYLTKNTPTLTYDAFWRVSVPLDGSSHSETSDVLPHRWGHPTVPQLREPGVRMLKHCTLVDAVRAHCVASQYT